MTEQEPVLSWKALGRVVVMGVLVFLAWKALGVFVDMLIALILATALFPIVKKMSAYMPLIVSIIIVALIFLVPIVLIAIFVVPTLVHQFPDLINSLRTVLDRVPFLPQSVRNFNVGDYISSHASVLLASAPVVISTLVSIITVIFLVFYLIVDHVRLSEFFLELFPTKEQPKIKGLLVELAKVNGQYIRGNLIISVICSVVLYVGMLILKVPFALPLAIFAGILDLLPLVGSTLGAIPAVIIAFTISPLKGILVIVLHLLYQQAENVIISPAIYNKALNLSPALSFISVVIGGGLFGILGAFLALPVAASVPSMIKYLRGYTERHAEAA